MSQWLKARIATLAVAVAATLSLSSGVSHAADLREALFGPRADQGRRAATPTVARYVGDDGRAFVLDLSAPRPLMRYEGSVEIWALSPTPAPRGDIIYRNDLGQPVLRATRLGGVTVFTATRPTGEAVALSGDGGPIRLAPMGPVALLNTLKAASLRASRAARRLIPMEAEDATPQNAALIADAAMVASEAVTRLAARRDASAALKSVGRINLTEGREPGVRVSGGVMHIQVTPSMGLAGRPSSERIVRVAASR